MRKLKTTLLIALFLGMMLLPAISLNVQGAIITINTDTYWTTSQTNVDGYIVNGGATLYICANGSVGDIVIVFGDASAGRFSVEDDGRLVLITGNNSNVIYMGGGGVAPNQGDIFRAMGVMETDYRGTGTAQTVFIGVGATGNKTLDNQVQIHTQPSSLIENVRFVTSYTYPLIYGNGAYFKNCQMGLVTDAWGWYPNQRQEFWVEDCYIRRFNLAYAPIINEVGTIIRGVADVLGTQNEIYRYWSRLFPRVVDESNNPIDNATVTVMDIFGKGCFGGRTNSTGLMNDTTTRYNLQYLLSLNRTVDEFNGWQYYTNDTNQSIITVSADGYLTNITTHNMTLDWGNATDPIDFELELDLERANQTIRTYDTNLTDNETSRFVFADIVYGNGTITFAHDITNVNVNVSIENESGIWVTDLMATTTQSFEANTMINLTEINGGVLNWTPTEEGQLYMKLNTWKDNEVDNFNTTEDFLIQNESAGSPGPGSASGTYTPPVIYPSPTPAANETWMDLQWAAFGVYIANNQEQMIFLVILLIAGIVIYGSTKQKKRKKPET